MGETRLAMPLAMFNNRFYALGEDGRIRQYALTEPGRAPRHWADAGRSPRDLAMGDDLYVLLGDGTIATFGQRALVARSAPTLSLPMVTPIAIVAGAASHGLYLLDPSSEIGPMRGRIVFIGESGEVRQFLPPMAVDRDAASAVALADARDLAVDEAAGVLYIVTGRDVWWAPLPPV
jgi:hypothetical protein